MGNIADKWFGINPPKVPSPTPIAPLPTAETGDMMNTLQRARRRSGRAATILTGDLVPMDIGKRTLLG